MTQQIHYRTCHLCEAMCGIQVEWEGKEIRSIRGDRDDPLSQGHVCPKVVAVQDVYNDPDRLKHPIRRTASGWERISWEEALQEVAERLHATQRDFGRDAVGVYLGNPNVHKYGNILFGLQFLQTLQTKNRFSATSVDQLPHMLAAYWMFGHQFLIPVPDVDRTEFFVIMGANPLVSNGSLMTAPGIKKRLRAIQKRGGRIVVLDPRRTETAELADEHHFVQPGTDALLLLGVLATLFEEELWDVDGDWRQYTEGVDAFWETVRGYLPERVAGPTGMKAEMLRQIARDFAKAPSAVWYGRLGTCTQAFGGLNQWLINALNLVTGRLDEPGGAMFSSPAFDLVGMGLVDRGHYDRWRSRVRNLPEFSDELPSSTMAEEMLTPGPGQIRSMMTIAGNPVLSTPHGTQLEKALQHLDFFVSLDIYINETTQHAHIILPTTTALEDDQYDVIFHSLAVRNTAKFSPALFPPEGDTKHDWEILLELMTRLEQQRGALRGWGASARRAVLQRLGPKGILRFALRLGPHSSKWNPWGGLRLGLLEKEPHGVDLGPLQPCLPKRLQHRNKKIVLLPGPVLDDLKRLEETFLAPSPDPIDEDGPSEPSSTFSASFVLIGRRHLRSNNSWLHNCERLVRGNPRCTLLMHPLDAQEHGWETGQKVQVRSRVGAVALPLEISDEIMPGVVSLPHGWGHHRSGSQMQVAQQHAGVSANDLTDDGLVDLLSGTSVLNGIPVEVLGPGMFASS